MKINMSKHIICHEFPCTDVRHECFVQPDIELDPKTISIVLISECAPPDPRDYYYSEGYPDFQRTTVQAFQDAGAEINSVQELLNMGVYLTSAVKCGKTGYGINTATIKECSNLLEQELALFPEVRAYLLMGDVAIKSLNYIAKRAGEQRVIPAGSTYKIRGGEYSYRTARAFPSYLQVGPSFGIEKSKQRMIAEDIAAALSLLP